MKRACAVVLCIVVLTACGKSSPTTPTPQPTPTPTPTVPSLTGTWTGTATIVAQSGGLSGSNVCTVGVVVTSQTQGNYVGTFQLTGGTTTACASAGTVSGTVGTDNALTLQLSTVIGSGCTRTSGDGIFRGMGTVSALSGSMSEGLSCNGTAATRNTVIALGR